MSYSIFFLASNTVVSLFTVEHKIADFVSVLSFYDGIYLKGNSLMSLNYEFVYSFMSHWQQISLILSSEVN